MKAKNIKWYTYDYEVNGLPTEVELPDELTNEKIDYDGIDEYLYNNFHFIKFGYDLVK